MATRTPLATRSPLATRTLVATRTPLATGLVFYEYFFHYFKNVNAPIWTWRYLGERSRLPAPETVARLPHILLVERMQ